MGSVTVAKVLAMTLAFAMALREMQRGRVTRQRRGKFLGRSR